MYLSFRIFFVHILLLWILVNFDMEEVETAEELLAKQQRKEKKDLQGKKTCHDYIYKY